MDPGEGGFRGGWGELRVPDGLRLQLLELPLAPLFPLERGKGSREVASVFLFAEEAGERGGEPGVLGGGSEGLPG